MLNTEEVAVVDKSAPRASRAAWAGVVALSLGTFAMVMAEFLPASLLPQIAADIGVADGAAGQAVSVTAFAACLSALFVSSLLPRADRRRVMIGLSILAIISNLAVALAPNLAVLLSARVLVGVALGGFWAMATAIAAHLVPVEQVGRALTVVNSGVSVATIAAIPLGALLGDLWGWRGVFVLAAVIALVALIAQAAALPRIAPTAGTGIRALGAVLRSGLVLAGLGAILLIFSGHFTGFTYIRPAVEALSSIESAAFAALLLAFGVANFLGTAVAGPLADRRPRAGVLLFSTSLGTGMLLMLATGSNVAGLFAAAALWGFGFGGVPTTVLSWGARVEPNRLEQIGGVVVTIANVAITIGALGGGLLVDGAATTAPLLAGGIVAIGGGIVLAILRQRG